MGPYGDFGYDFDIGGEDVLSTDDEMRNNEANEMEEERWRQFLDVPDDDGPPIHRTTVEEARWRQYLDVPDDEQAGTLTEGLERVDEDEVRERRRRLLRLAEQRRTPKIEFGWSEAYQSVT